MSATEIGGAVSNRQTQSIMKSMEMSELAAYFRHPPEPEPERHVFVEPEARVGREGRDLFVTQCSNFGILEKPHTESLKPG